MSSSGSGDATDAGPFEGSRVVVGVAHDATRATLVEWLAPDYDVVTADPDELPGLAPDLYVLDRPTLAAGHDAIEQARAAADPTHLPVLLAATPDDEPPLESAAAATDRPDELADDVVTYPLERVTVRRRARALLRIRSLSVEVAERHEQYHGLLDLLDDGICLLDDGTVTYVNDVGLRLLGVEQEAATGDPLTAFVAEGDVPVVESLLADVRIDGRATIQQPVTLTTGTGDAVTVSMSAVAVGDDGAGRMQIVFRDLRDSERKSDRFGLYLSALDAAAEGITIADVTRDDDPLIYANEAFAEITGYDVAEVLGRNCRFLQGTDTDPEPVATMRAAIAAREPATVTLRNYRADGTPFWNQVHLMPVDHGGETTHFLGFQRDVTERVRRERELGQYRTLVQAAGDPIYTLDAYGCFTDVNDTFVSFTGYDRADLIGAHASKVIDEQDVAVCRRRIADLLSSSDSTQVTVEIVVETVDGDRRLCEVSLGLLPFEAGQFGGTVGVVRDVTEPKGREQRLAVLDRVLRHNLRNKMNVILGRSEALREETDLDDDAAAHVDAVMDAAAELLDTSQDARRFRDVLALKEQEPSTLDLAALAADAVADKRAAFPDTDITVATPDEAPIRTRGRLRSAVDELLENVVEHSDRDRPTVDVTVRADGDRVVLEVADDGPRVPDFERRVVRDTVENPTEHGSGLGLWLVSWTVEQSGGEIEIVDNDPRGTVVRLRFPCA
ncbi:PAS domain S-box protein [Halorientalis marina]|uniref:PAS domain S-box protein n=1 Tax=Halorientalis marina TaxID=2931976 RepID=UPI001FF36146|nr:PAS domain S-box protein [Halorientalis marina]